MSKNNGGPAFPCRGIPLDPDTYLNHPGMTLRDYFAAKALEGELASQGTEGHWTSTALLVVYAYEIADAMLKARES